VDATEVQTTGNLEVDDARAEQLDEGLDDLAKTTIDQQSVEVLVEHVEQVVQGELGQKAVYQWTTHVLSQLAVTIYHLHLHIPQNTMKIRSRATWQDTFSFYKSLFNPVAVKLILSC